MLGVRVGCKFKCWVLSWEWGLSDLEAIIEVVSHFGFCGWILFWILGLGLGVEVRSLVKCWDWISNPSSRLFLGLDVVLHSKLIIEVSFRVKKYFLLSSKKDKERFFWKIFFIYQPNNYIFQKIFSLINQIWKKKIKNQLVFQNYFSSY